MKRKQSILDRIDVKLAGTILLVLWLPLPGNSQGEFVLSTRTAPTRIGSASGSLAGRGIWGQALAGFAADSLTPVGLPSEHYTNGLVFGQTISVPFAVAATTVLVQMAAWDGTLWGTSFAGVPGNQLGFTDVMPVFLVSPLGSQEFPHFTSPAVVPVVPEPSATALALLGGAAILVHLRRRRRSPPLRASSGQGAAHTEVVAGAIIRPQHWIQRTIAAFGLCRNSLTLRPIGRP